MKEVLIPGNLQGKNLFEFLIANKGTLIAQKKFEMKRADAFSFSTKLYDKDAADKANTAVADDLNELKVMSVINTTNWFDSHKDVHLPGLWKKSLRENKYLYLLEEHVMSFKKIIAEGKDIEAYTKNFLWKDFGLKIPGQTEALVFESKIKRSRNEFMFDQYKAGYVRNHSVGMRYVNIELAINDEEYKEEFATWNKYIGEIANIDEVEEAGYFWPVKEAKVVEGSAVVIGSNIMTPTFDNNMKDDNSTAETKPPVSTSKDQPQHVDVDAWIKTVKFFN